MSTDKNMFDNFEVDPGSQMWERIEKQLPPEKKKRKGLMWFFASAFLLVALTAVSFYVILKDDDAAQQIATSQNTNVNSNAIKTASDSLNDNIQIPVQEASNNTSVAENKTGNVELANVTKAPKLKTQKNKIIKHKNESIISDTGENEITNLQIDSTAIAKNDEEPSEKLNAENFNTNNELPVVDSSIASNKFSRYMIDSLLGNLNNISFFDSIKTEKKAERKSRFRVGLMYARLHNETEMTTEEFTYEAITYDKNGATSPGLGSSGYFAMADYVSEKYFRARIGIGTRKYSREESSPSLWADTSGYLFVHTSIGNLIHDNNSSSYNGSPLITVSPIPSAYMHTIILPQHNAAGDSAKLNITERINMIDIPIMFGWQFVKNRKLTPYMLIGSHIFIPYEQLSLLWNETKYWGSQVSYSNKTKYKLSIAPCVLAGIEYKISPKFYFQTNFGYTIAVTPIMVTESKEQGARRTLRFDHYEFQAGLQYRFK